MPEPITIYYHIPKTAGTTFRDLLMYGNRLYPPNSVLSLDNWQHGVEPGSTEESFFTWSSKKKSTIRCICGHLTWQKRDLLPAPANWITFLREPIPLLRSYHAFARRHTSEPWHKEAKTMGLSEMVRHRMSVRLDNLQVRWLSEALDKVPFGALKQIHLDQAKRTIEKFAGIGLVEQFNRSLILLTEALNWPVVPTYRSFNRTPTIESDEIWSNETSDWLVATQSWDIELYQWASERFHCDWNALGDTGSRRLEFFESEQKIFDRKLAGGKSRSVLPG